MQRRFSSRLSSRDHLCGRVRRYCAFGGWVAALISQVRKKTGCSLFSWSAPTRKMTRASRAAAHLSADGGRRGPYSRPAPPDPLAGQFHDRCRDAEPLPHSGVVFAGGGCERRLTASHELVNPGFPVEFVAISWLWKLPKRLTVMRRSLRANVPPTFRRSRRSSKGRE